MLPSFKSSLERALLAADLELQHWAAAYPAAERVRMALAADVQSIGWADAAQGALAEAHAVMSVPGFGDVASDMAILMIEQALRRPVEVFAA
jgi:hypothetical protein